MKQPWNQTSHAAKGSGDAGISKESVKPFTSESRSSAGESVSSSDGTLSYFPSGDKASDHDGHASESL
ncbi:hypothetical protein BGZ83_005447, partial [Gryganskiella cystojenkinii]